MVIDFHTHYFPDNIVEKAMNSLTSMSKLTPFTDGTLSGLKKSMLQAGIDYSLNLPLATSADSVRGINKWASVNNQAPVFSLGSIHPDTKNPEEIIPWIKELGMKGLKMHPEYQQFNPLEKRLEKIWEECIKNDIFVLIHAGRDISFAPPPKSDPRSFAELYRRYPELKLVLAHMGSWGMWDDVKKLICGLPFYLDMAFTAGHLEETEFVSLIKNHGADKILFGTDSPWNCQKESLEFVRALPLTQNEIDSILYKNAAGLLGITY